MKKLLRKYFNTAFFFLKKLSVPVFFQKNLDVVVLSLKKLDIVALLFPQEMIGGLEIGDDFLRIIFLKKQNNAYNAVFKKEVSLPSGVIINGVVQNIDSLTQKLKELFESGKVENEYSKNVILVAPENIFFIQPFSVPPSLSDDDVTSLIVANASSIFPGNLSNVYFDWQDIEVFDSKRLILMASAKRSVIDKYRQALALAGLSIIAVESPTLSLERQIEFAPDYFVVFFKKGDNAVEAIYLNGKLYWRRVLKKISDKAEYLSDFISSELSNRPITEIRAEDFNKLTDEWSLAKGAAIRGLMPRESDRLISILPIGTEEMYKRQRQQKFFSSIKSISYAFLMVYLISFAAVSLFMTFLLRIEQENVDTQKNINYPPELISLEGVANEFNASVKNILLLSVQIFSPTPLLKEIRKINYPGVTILRVSFQNTTKSPLVSLVAVASTRESLLLFKSELEKNASFSNVQVPLSSFEQRSNITFTISFNYTR